MRTVALAVLACLTCSPAPAAVLTYGGEKGLTPAESILVRNALAGGWSGFAAIVGSDPTPPEIVETAWAQARVAVVRGAYPTAAEVRWADGEDRQPYVYLWIDVLATYAPIERDHVLAHEFLHFYHRLPDHHRGPFGGDRPECVMDNFFRYGWTGRLCGPCRAKVAARRRQDGASA